jgi:lysozyme family protein
MADWKQAIDKTLAHEGGYQNNPKDWANWRGGKPVMQQYLASKDSSLLVNLIGTNWGITAQDMPLLTAAQMKALTKEQAEAYYREHYWKDLYSQINSQPLAEKLFDMGVLFGVGTATKLLQISLKDDGSIFVVPDGVFGPNTLAATNDHGDVNKFRVVLYNHAMEVVNHNPDDVEFLHGWTVRIQS